MLGLGLDGYHNQLVPSVDGATVEAVLSVTGTETGSQPASQPHRPQAVVLVLDCSAAMTAGTGWPEALRQAAASALDALRPGTAFAVIAGSDEAHLAYPPDGGLAVYEESTAQDARRAVTSLAFGGATRIDRWLDRAAELLAAAGPEPLGEVLLVAAGRNTDGPQALLAAAERHQGAFRCDVRGVGRQWDVKEFQAVAAALSGSLDLVADPLGPGRLEHELRDVLTQAMGRTLGEVLLEVRTRADVQLLRARQISPAIARLTPARTADSGLSLCWSTGAWGAETREYLLRMAVRPGRAGTSALLAQVGLLLDPGPGRGPLQRLASWSLRVDWADPSDDAAWTVHPHLEVYGLGAMRRPAAELSEDDSLAGY